jgi:hypothetical protein
MDASRSMDASVERCSASFPCRSRSSLVAVCPVTFGDTASPLASGRPQQRVNRVGQARSRVGPGGQPHRLHRRPRADRSRASHAGAFGGAERRVAPVRISRASATKSAGTGVAGSVGPSSINGSAACAAASSGDRDGANHPPARRLNPCLGCPCAGQTWSYQAVNRPGSATPGRASPVHL